MLPSLAIVAKYQILGGILMYTPQFSDYTCITVRRLSWALGIPMTAAVERMAKLLPTLFDPSVVCLSCKDQTKCDKCGFRNIPETSEIVKLLAM